MHAHGQRFRRIQQQPPALDLQQRRDIELVELDGQLHGGASGDFIGYDQDDRLIGGVEAAAGRRLQFRNPILRVWPARRTAKAGRRRTARSGRHVPL